MNDDLNKLPWQAILSDDVFSLFWDFMQEPISDGAPTAIEERLATKLSSAPTTVQPRTSMPTSVAHEEVAVPPSDAKEASAPGAAAAETESKPAHLNNDAATEGN